MAVSDQAVLTSKQLETLSINTIRTLSIDAVQKANSGHPGAPMGFAPVAYCLWQQFLRYDPANPGRSLPREDSARNPFSGCAPKGCKDRQQT